MTTIKRELLSFVGCKTFSFFGGEEEAHTFLALLWLFWNLSLVLSMASQSIEVTVLVVMFS